MAKGPQNPSGYHSSLGFFVPRPPEGSKKIDPPIRGSFKVPSGSIGSQIRGIYFLDPFGGLGREWGNESPVRAPIVVPRAHSSMPY